MSNQIYNHTLYNAYQKERFLNQFETQTKESYRRILLRASVIEKQRDKDLFSFNLKEIEEVLKYLNPISLISCKGNGSVIAQYIRWAIDQDLRMNNINPLEGVAGDEYYKTFVNSKRKFFTNEELDDIVDRCVNYQDKIIFQLIFEGVQGVGYEELINLKEKDFDEESRVLTLNEGTEKERYIMVSEKCASIIKGVLNEKTYYKRNNEFNSVMKAKPESDLVESVYMLKIANTNPKKQNLASKVDNHLILRRIKMIRTVLGIPHCTVTTIRYSGMLYMAKVLYERDGELERRHYDMIAEKFGVSKINNSGHINYNYYPYKADFLNIETIKKLYEI